MGEVIPLPGHARIPGSPEPIPEVCTSLRAHWDKAQRGEITSFRIIYRDHEGATYMVDVGETWTDMA
jgi:hypothetical protein